MHDTRNEGPARPSAATEPRRAMLRAFLGGFTLAASGLFLPARGDEADAREGAYGGKLGGRHGRNRRGRDRSNRSRHRRGRDRKPDRDPPRGPFDGEGVRNIMFIVINNDTVGTDPVLVTRYSYRWGTDEVVGEEEKNLRAGAGVSFDTGVKFASLYIDHERHVVWAKNPFYGLPTIEIAMTANGLSTAGPTGLEEGATLSLQRANYTIAVQRLPDDDTHKIFTVSYDR